MHDSAYYVMTRDSPTHFNSLMLGFAHGVHQPAIVKNQWNSVAPNICLSSVDHHNFITLKNCTNFCINWDQDFYSHKNISEITYNMSSWTLNATHSHSLTRTDENSTYQRKQSESIMVQQ